MLAVVTVAHFGLMKARDAAIDAQDRTQIALVATRKAKDGLTDALRRQRLSEASYVRLSAVPGRRKTGLDLLEGAAKLNPDAALHAKLRDEAAEIFAIRDVEPSAPIEAGPTQAVAFGPSGNRLAMLSADGSVLSLWDASRREKLVSHRLGDPILAPAGGPPGSPYGSGDPHRGVPGGSRLASSGHMVAAIRPDGGGVRLFDSYSGAAQGELATPGREVVSLLAAGPRLVTVDRPRRGGAQQVRVWDPEHSEGPIASLPEWEDPEPNAPGPPRGRPMLVALSPDGETIATARPVQTDIALWSAHDGRSRGTIEAGMPVMALALGPEGLLAAAGGGSIRLWESDTLTPLPSIIPHQAIVQMLRFSPDGSTLALAGRDAGIELWDTATTAPVAFLPMAERITDLTFSRPLGKALAAAIPGGTAVATWSAVDPIGLIRLPESKGPTTSLAFGPSGVLAVASMEGPLRLWTPGTCPTTSPTWGHVQPSSVAFGAGGMLLAIDAQGLTAYPAPLRRGCRIEGAGRPGPPGARPARRLEGPPPPR